MKIISDAIGDYGMSRIMATLCSQTKLGLGRQNVYHFSLACRIVINIFQSIKTANFLVADYGPSSPHIAPTTKVA
jgi:hypothetical protein